MSDDRFDNRRYYNEDTFSIQSTAGAVPVRNKKGEVSMEKVKVSRYISGKRPEYASRGRDERSSSESDSSDEEDFTKQRQKSPKHEVRSDEEDEHVFLEPSVPVKFEAEEAADVNDPRLRRLRAARTNVEDRHAGSDEEDAEDDRMSRHRRIHEPEVLSDGEDDEDDDKEAEDNDAQMDSDEGSTSGEEDLDEAGILRRRELMRQRALARAQIGMGQEEVMAKEEEKEQSASENEEETTEEETTDSEGEEGARLKPVFVRKKDRLTVQEREREEAKQRQAEREAQILAEQRRRDTLRMVESAVKLEVQERKTQLSNDPDGELNTVNTDDENEEIEYEAWKLRELKRLKRDRDEKEERAREAAEVERLRNMTDEERRLELKHNPKTVTNKAAKGKYKFLQKYYHRGAFFLDKEENVFSRDVTSATLEDKFDKTVLPKVMQVKNFGRSGRTKYTHLVDQDTTQMDAAWSQETQQNLKFQVHHAAGMKNVFERPSAKKKK